MDRTRMVIIAIGFIGCLAVGGIVIEKAMGQSADGVLASIATGCVGALVGILADPRQTESGRRSTDG